LVRRAASTLTTGHACDHASAVKGSCSLAVSARRSLTEPLDPPADQAPLYHIEHSRGTVRQVEKSLRRIPLRQPYVTDRHHHARRGVEPHHVHHGAQRKLSQGGGEPMWFDSFAPSLCACRESTRRRPRRPARVSREEGRRGQHGEEPLRLVAMVAGGSVAPPSRQGGAQWRQGSARR